MTQSNQPLGWLKKLVPSAIRSSVRSAISGEAPAPAEPAATTAEPASTHVVFLPRDPQWAYCFWSITSADQQRARKAGATSLCLRVADVTGLGFEQSHPHALQELVVDAGATEWFLPMPVDGRDYRVELGYRLRNGGWFSLAFSSVAHVPALEPSQRVADAFVPFTLDGPIGPATEALGGGGVQHEQLYQIATARPARSRRVGSELLHEYDAESGGGLFGDSGVGVWASGSGSGIVRPRSFWLVADAELIVYGATEPSASLFIGDEQIPLDADGTFRVHVPFRDGQQVYPIRAVAADGEQERSIRMEFDRNTPQARVNTREQAELEWF
jgi:hypothetical protein